MTNATHIVVEHTKTFSVNMNTSDQVKSMLVICTCRYRSLKSSIWVSLHGSIGFFSQSHHLKTVLKGIPPSRTSWKATLWHPVGPLRL